MSAPLVSACTQQRGLCKKYAWHDRTCLILLRGTMPHSLHAQALRLLLGEGDQYSAFEDIDLVQVVWWNMENDTLVRKLTPSEQAATPATPVTSTARQRALL